MTFREWLQAHKDREIDIDLAHYDVDGGYPTVAAFSIDQLTEEGLQFFEDVLNATIFYTTDKGYDHYSVVLRGCYESRVERLCNYQAGLCSSATWAKLFKEDENGED